MIRKLAITAAILATLGFGADLIAQRAAEAALSKAASNALGIEGEIRVDVEGFPILFDVLRGRLDGISASVSGHRIEDLVLRTVAVRLDDLRAEGSFFGDGALSIVAARIELVAEADERAINGFLKRRGEDARVELLDGEIRVTAQRTIAGVPRTFVATGPLAIRDRTLVFRPRKVTWEGPTFPGAQSFAREVTTVREELPTLPGGIGIDAVTIGGGVVRFTGSGEGRTFKVRG